MKRKTKITAILVVMAILFTSCYPKGNKPVERQGFYMGTVITEKVYGKDAEKAADEAMKRIKQLESMMTINAPGSEIDALNENAGKESVKLSAEAMFLLEEAKKYSALSEGNFDVSIGPLVKAWGIFTDNPRIPAQNEINKLKALVDYRDINTDNKNLTAKLSRPNQIVDLGGIAKGYAGDQVIEIYKKYKIDSAYINLGGNVVVLGKKPDGSEWKIGIQNPRAENGKYIGIVSLSDKAVVSSGDYERFFERDGVRYHHILDPKTGYPADSGLIGTTIIAGVSADADALSTATFVLGLEKGMKLVEGLEGVEAIFVTKDKKVYITDGLKSKFTFDDESKEFQYVQKR